MINNSLVEQESSNSISNNFLNESHSSQIDSNTFDIRQRYWKFLFDNLKRSIEQLYQTCESDYSSIQCQEIVQYLSQCRKDFELLIKRFQYDLPKSYEQLQPFYNDDSLQSDDSLRRQKRYHSSELNLNVNNFIQYRSLNDSSKLKRQKSNKYRISPDNSSLFSLTLTNDSSGTFTGNSSQLSMKKSFTDDEGLNNVRYHRYHSMKQHDETSEDDEILLKNHCGMMDFMDRQILDAFEQEECLSAALEAEQERTIASLMAEQEDLEQQINNVQSDDSELEENDLSTTKTSSYFMSLNEDHDEKDFQLIDLSRDENDSDVDGKSRTRNLRLHEKLSSPSRIRPLSEKLRESAERQVRALNKRQTLRNEKARKLRELTQRVDEVRQWKEELINERKTTIEMKMQHAEEKRQYLLLFKAKKAREEELKGQEIAFIKCLQQENRRQTLKERYQKEEQFKQYLEEERVKKHDEHKQKELAAENRRKELEARRQTRLNQMQEKWKTKERMIEQNLNEKRKQKQTAAIAKQKNFQQKRAERDAHLNESTVELKRKLALKQEETNRRHITQLEEIRRKAIEMSTFRSVSAENHETFMNDETNSTLHLSSDDLNNTRKCCTICNLLLTSEIHLQTHLRGTRHNQLLIERWNQKFDENSKRQPTQDDINIFNNECVTIVTNDDIIRREIQYNRERKHSMKKRAKKLRLRIIQRSTTYENENNHRIQLTSTNRARIQRFLNELERSLNTTNRKEPLNITNYISCQRILTEFVKIFDTHGYEKDSPLEQRVFLSLNGYSTLNKLIELRAESNQLPLAPESLIALTVLVYRSATINNFNNAMYLLYSGKILTLIESFVRHLNNFKNDDLIANTEQNEIERLAHIDLLTYLADTLTYLLTTYNLLVRNIENNESKEDKLIISRVTDLINYMANVGVPDRISLVFRTTSSSIHTTKSRLPDMINNCLNLLQKMIEFSKKSLVAPFNQQTKKSINDSAQILNIMKSTNFCETLSLLYGILIHETDMNNLNFLDNQQNTICLQDKIITIIVNALTLLNTIAILDLDIFQMTLAEETISLQFRHVANYILAYYNQKQSTINDNLLHQIIVLIGYYCVLNQNNQCCLAFGNRPTVLQQLSCLPFRYFVETKYNNILFPTLISCSYDCDTTRTILQSEMSLDLIVNYIQTKIDIKMTMNHNDDNQLNIFSFHMRFPEYEWSNALKYFQSTVNCSDGKSNI